MKIRDVLKKLPFGIATKIILLKLVNKILGNFTSFFYSQTGEDIIISTLLGHKKNGFYIDIGCNDPIRYSNTFQLYLNGWSGICVDANSQLVKKFKKVRTKDICLNNAISDKVEVVELYVSGQDLVTTINKKFRNEWHEDWVSSEKIEFIKTVRLDSILEGNLKSNLEIDLLTVDVEGQDYQVLKSIDLEKYKPQLIVVEMHDFDFENLNSNPVYTYLTSSGYSLKSFATMNGYFQRN